MNQLLVVRQRARLWLGRQHAFRDLQSVAYSNPSSKLAAAEPLFKFGFCGFFTAIPAVSPSSGPPNHPVALNASSKRVVTPNWSKMLLRCCLTVSSWILKYSAISLLE